MVMSLYLYQTVDLNQKTLLETLEEYFIIRGSVQQKYVTIIHLYTSHNTVSKSIKQKLTEPKGITE